MIKFKYKYKLDDKQFKSRSRCMKTGNTIILLQNMMEMQFLRLDQTS